MHEEGAKGYGSFHGTLAQAKRGHVGPTPAADIRHQPSPRKSPCTGLTALPSNNSKRQLEAHVELVAPPFRSIGRVQNATFSENGDELLVASTSEMLCLRKWSIALCDSRDEQLEKYRQSVT